MTSEVPNLRGGVAFGARLKALRREAGMTLESLAQASGLSMSQLSRLENGKKKVTLDAMRPLAEVYAMSLDELVGHPQGDDLYVAHRVEKRDGYSLMLLTRRPATLVLLQIAPGTILPLVEHGGSEFIYVLSGQVEVVRDGRSYTLEAKRGLSFSDAQVEHSLGNRSKEEAIVQVMVSEHGERAHLFDA